MVESVLDGIRPRTPDAYARAGVSQTAAGSAVEALVRSLGAIDTGKPSRVVPLPGHYASVLRLDDRTGLALSTDTVGTKMVVAERLGRYDTIGIDCVAMGVNDVICVGAEPIALLDFILTERADPGDLRAARGRAGARSRARRASRSPGARSPRWRDRLGPRAGRHLRRAGRSRRDRHRRLASSPGDPVIGLPSSGLHSNGYTLARRALERRPAGRRAPRAGRWATSCSSRPRSTCGRSSSCFARRSTSAGLPTSPATASTTCCASRPRSGTRSTPRSPCRRCSASSRSSARSPTTRCTRSSTWAAGSAAWSLPMTRTPRSSRCATITRMQGGSAGSRTGPAR